MENLLADCVQPADNRRAEVPGRVMGIPTAFVNMHLVRIRDRGGRPVTRARGHTFVDPAYSVCTPLGGVLVLPVALA